MATGGKFILENLYEGRAADQYLLNTSLLEKTIRERCENRPILQDLKTHVAFVKKYYKPPIPMAYEFQSLMPESGALSDGSVNRFSLMQYGNYQCEMVLEINLGVMSTVSPLDRCGYYDFPGHRIMQHTSIDFAGNIIDEYSSDAYNVYYNYFVSEDKRLAWQRGVGQETPSPVYIQQDLSDNWREARQIVNGPQTPKQEHRPLRMFIPIIFDMSRKTHTALFSAKIPYGQRFLKVNLARLQDIIYVNDNGGGGAVNLPTISGRLWVNHIFIDPAIVKILLPGNYITLMRIFKEQRVQAKVGENLIKLDQLAYPCEHIYFGLRPTGNIGPTTWWRFHVTDTQDVIIPVRIPSGIIPPNQLAFLTAPLITPSPPIRTVQFLSKNTEITRLATGDFHTILMPLIKSRGPQDEGIMLHSFARDTFTDEPTAYFNISTSREFYISLDTAVAGEIYILTYCWNWMIIDNGGNVTLRYKAN